MLDAITAPSVRDLLIKANSVGITKQEFVQIIPIEDQFALVFEPIVKDTDNDKGGV